MGLMNAARTRVGAAVIGGTLLALGGGVAATAAVLDSPPAEPVGDTTPTDTAAPTTAAGPIAPPVAATTEAPPVTPEEPSAEVPTGTVGDVTEPEAEPTGPYVDPEYDPTVPHVQGGVTYMPEPPAPPEPTPPTQPPVG